MVADEGITVRALAAELGVKEVEVIQSMIHMGELVTAVNVLDAETAELVRREFKEAAQ